MSRIKVSIIIVYYNGFTKFNDTLNSIFNKKWRAEFEVIVVNNSSKELPKSLKKKFSKVVFVKSPRNGGYGYGNNIGAKHAKGEYLFILNPDTKLLSGSMDELLFFLDSHKEVGIVAPNLLTPKGNLFPQMGSADLTPLRGLVAFSFINSLFPNNPVSQRYWLTKIPKDKVREVGVVPGSAFVIHRNLFNETNGFDENFFLFFEESDLCKRVKNQGYKICFDPNAEVEHFWTHKKRRTNKINNAFQESRFYYFKKHYSLPWAIIIEIFARFSPRKIFSF